jgi:hypothetical protein
VIDNEGIFVKEFDRENALEISEGFTNLQDYRFCRVKDSIEPEALRAGGQEGRQGGSIGL